MLVNLPTNNLVPIENTFNRNGFRRELKSPPGIISITIDHFCLFDI